MARMALIIEVKAVPNSGRNAWILDKSGLLKVFLKEAAQKGNANHEIIESLAHILKIPRSAITIITGLTTPKKRIKINSAITYEQVLTLLHLEKQKKFIE